MSLVSIGFLLKRLEMIQQKNNYFLYILSLQLFSLFSYESSPDSCATGNMPQAQIQLNNPNLQSPCNWRFSANAHTIPNYSDAKSVHHGILTQASPQLQHYFATFVAPLMYNAMINN